MRATGEVTGYADETTPAGTLFPVVPVRDVRAFLDEFLPELADDPGDLQPLPARAARRYLLAPALVALAVTVGLWFLVGPFALLALVLAAYGWARFRAAAWRVRDGRLAVRSLTFARVTVLAPVRLRESQTVSQNPFQRRADLATLAVPFGKSTTARIRHLDVADANRALGNP